MKRLITQIGCNIYILQLIRFVRVCNHVGTPGFNCLCFFFSFAPGFSKLFGAQGSPSSGSLLSLLSSRFLFIMVVIMISSFVLDDSLTS